jgi:glutamate--cysteine ligase
MRDILTDAPLHADDVERHIAEWCWRPAVAVDAAHSTGTVGVEREVFVLCERGDDPPARAARRGIVGVLEALGPAGGLDGGALVAAATDGGCLTLEPGGQVEHATRAHDSCASAVTALEAQAVRLRDAFVAAGMAVAAAGIDVWTDVQNVPLHVAVPRYEAMDAYFRRRHGAEAPGALMMRHTCALQVCLDLGPAGGAAQRWTLANLVSPLLTATFATSPGPQAVSERACVWQQLDRGRTGHPPALVSGAWDDPVTQLALAALAADVLLFRRRDGSMVPGEPAFAFGDWLREGHPEHGRPTVEDLRYHLTTLWHDVRLRGYLEIRSIDALPLRWTAVPVVLLAGLLYDRRARDDAYALLEPHLRSLPALARRAAAVGLADPQLRALATATWSLALAGATRLPPGYVRPGDLLAAEGFLDRFALRGRCPGDELREQLAISARAALAWASDLLPTVAHA